MGYVYSAAKYGRLAENHIFHTRPISVKRIFYTAEPDHISHSGPIGKMGHKPLLATLTYLFKTQNLPFQLDIRHCAVHLAYTENTAAVYVFIRKIVEQVMERFYLKLPRQQGSPYRTYTGQILDITLLKIKHQARPNIISSHTEAAASSPRNNLIMVFANSTAAAGPQAVITFPSFSTNDSVQTAPFSISSKPG
ncbi:MAG: hypothetical protein BWY95_01067 [Bacteroidetes bacterium ADurb.BinA104]|nr:MAG: hypothetical protein BWY95_01067 [Bacteroidetes bacterium ADurb.BinA104]